MPSVSTVPTVKAAILAMLQARSGLANVSVTWGWLGKNAPDECVMMAPAEFSNEAVTQLRAKPHQHDETYVIPVWVDVRNQDADTQTAETRMWVIVGEVEDAFRNAPNLGDLPGTLSAIVTGKEPHEYMTDQGWGASCRINVEVKGRA